MDAYEIQVEWDEGGCYVDLTISEDAWQFVEGSTVRLRVTEPEQLYDRVKAAILPWLMERDDALREYRLMEASVGADADDFRDWQYEVANGDTKLDLATWVEHRRQAEALDPSDPKHPDWHSVHADIWDLREGK